MTRSSTPPLSNGSTSSSDHNPPEPVSTSPLPNYDLATRSAPRPSTHLEHISATLHKASIKICDGPGLTQDERIQLEKALNDGLRVGLDSASKPVCSLPDLKAHLKLLNLFDRLRNAIQDGTEYFDYPSCRQQDVHIDEPGIDAPPPPYAPAPAPAPAPATAQPPSALNSKSCHPPTQHEAQAHAAELTEQLLRERRWSNYLNRAAYRLELWCTHILSSDTLTKHAQALKDTTPDNLTKPNLGGFELPDYALPPIDVALMLHAYHLNPLNKEEDTLRLRTRQNLAIFNYPLCQLAERAHPTLPILIDVELAKLFWDQRITTNTRSKQPWDLSLQPPPGLPTYAQETHGGTIFGLRVNCPRCKTPHYIPWTGVGEGPLQSGIGEPGWQRACVDAPRCSQLISADHLQMRRFLDDFAIWRRAPGRIWNNKRAFFMAGTMVGASYSMRSSRDYFGEALLTPIFQHEKPIEASPHKDRRVASNAKLEEMEAVAIQCNYNIKVFREWFEDRWLSSSIQPKLKLPEEKSQQMARIAVLFRSYQNGNAAAYGQGLCDVVDAVKRQTTFNREMEKLGWSKYLELLQQGVLDDVLSRSLIRYHKFLDLMSATHTLLTPTLDIDLCWHTHQLQANYYDQCFKLVGRFVNHDDTIETGTLKDAFDRTAMLWKNRYHQPYCMCGCVYNNPHALKKLQVLLGGAIASKPAEPASEETQSKGSGFTARIKGKWRAAKELPGDKQETAAVWQDATHPSAHSAVIVKEEEHRHDKLRQEMIREWAQGKRREGHESAFVFDTPRLYPFFYSPLYSTHYVNRGSTCDATYNAYSLYSVYGLMAVTGYTGGPVFGGGPIVCAGGGGGGGCAGGGGGC